MSQDRAAQASAYLRMLLLRPGEYRKRWESFAEHLEPGKVDVTAVARVLAGRDDPGDLIDITSGALDGTALGAATLQRFIEAFALDARHAAQLRGLLSGSDAVRVITGDAQPVPGLYQHSGPPGHEMLSLHELHILGPDGLPAEHQTIQVIKATVDGLDTLPYRFDTDELAVEVIRGGTVGDRMYRVGAELYAVDLKLPRPLARGESELMQIRTTFFYKTPPAPEFRRGVLRSTRDLTIWIKFHRDRVPVRIWSAQWDRVDHARVVERQQVELDDELSVHCRYGAVESTIVGFYWEWD